MNVVFAGPSLHGLAFSRDGLELRPPATQGDVTRAVLDGADTIGIIDGVFGSAAAVWHREILHALSLGVRVLGASSMGALRAAECASYGMEPVGEIADRYVSGELDDDAAVALIFGPTELDYCPLSEPIVDVDDRVSDMLEAGIVTVAEASAITASARRLFYADRSIERLFEGTNLAPHRVAELIESYARLGPSAKQRDALELLEVIRSGRSCPLPSQTWQLSEPGFWKAILAGLSSDVNRVTLESR